MSVSQNVRTTGLPTEVFCFTAEVFSYSHLHLRDSRSSRRQQYISGWVRGEARKLTRTFHPSLP